MLSTTRKKYIFFCVVCYDWEMRVLSSPKFKLFFERFSLVSKNYLSHALTLSLLHPRVDGRFVVLKIVS